MDEDFDAIIAGTWVISSVPAALVGSLVVTVVTLDLMLGVTAAIAGLVMALVVGVVVWRMPELPFDVHSPDLSDPDQRVGRGLKMRRRLGVRDAIDEALAWLVLLAIFLGPAVAALVTPIIVGFLLIG